MSIFSKMATTLKSVRNPSAATYGDASNPGASLFLYVFFVLCGLDVVTRYLCFAGFCENTVTGWFGFVTFRNYDFAFSWKMPTALIYIIYAIVLFILVRSVVRSWAANYVGVNFAWLAICAGAAVNIADRLYFGYVRDFIRIGDGYFNLGDVWIVVGVTFICVHAVREAYMSAVTKA